MKNPGFVDAAQVFVKPVRRCQITVRASVPLPLATSFPGSLTAPLTKFGLLDGHDLSAFP